MQHFAGVVEHSLSFVGITLPIEYGPMEFALRSLGLLDMGHLRLRLLHVCNNMMRLLDTKNIVLKISLENSSGWKRGQTTNLRQPGYGSHV